MSANPEERDSLTPRQRELLDFIQSSVGQENRMPSYREMAKALNVSAVGTVQDLVRALVNKGHLEREVGSGSARGSSRNILKLGRVRRPSFVAIPVVGEVAAGGLRDAFEVALGNVTISPELLGGKAKSDDFFALRVSGESMIEAGILPGDIAILRKKTRVASGDIVVAEYAGEATLKEIEIGKRSEGGVIRLIPRNRSMRPIPVTNPDDLRVLGKLVAIQRSYQGKT